MYRFQNKIISFRVFGKYQFIAVTYSFNDRLELSRTYFEIGKRLLETGSKYRELDGIQAREYLEKAKTMFEEMGLQWDLDELEKLGLHMGH